MIDSSGDDLRVLRRTDDDLAARKALADIVVAVADQLEGDAVARKAPNDCPGVPEASP
jgi:hypothetical protein